MRKSKFQCRRATLLNKNKPGVTLIEALTVLFIFSLISVTFYQVISLGTKYIQDSKNRLGALAIANEKMEIVRNMDYDDIGTVSGSVTGDLLNEESVSENTKQYKIETFVEYKDDSFDGQYPADTVWGDYKKVTIRVSWNGVGGNSDNVELSSRFTPPGLEVGSPGDGILSINVFSDQPGGAGIAGSSVRVINTETALDTGWLTTDSAGNITLIGDKITESIHKYQISVEKAGYETVNTLPPYPGTAYNPTFPHGSVVSGAVNVSNIIQNELADLKIATRDYLDQAIADVGFHLSGGKKIGTEVSEPQDPVYNFSSDSSTDSSGEKDFTQISPGQFEFSLDSSAQSGYEIIGTDPSSSYAKDELTGEETYSFPLSSEPPLTFKVKLASKTATSVLVSVLKSDDNSPISEATVRLYNGSGYDATQTTGDDGKAFFPTDADPFLAGTYNLEVNADGFSGSSSEVIVEDGTFKAETVTLTIL